MGANRVLVVGAAGQIGTELVLELRNRLGANQVVAADIREPSAVVLEGGPFEIIDILDKARLAEVITKHEVSEIYQLAALLSATAEQKPMFGWKLNMEGLFNVLELGREGKLKKIFWPSSIAVFGPTTPKTNTPQHTIAEPSTVYGISKQAGEQWCAWYHEKYGVDVRGVRYPGLISYKSPPGGGTTDYAVDIFHQALANGTYTSFLSESTVLPMMYMPDALRATIGLMDAPLEQVKLRTGYNIAAMSFTPREIAAEIQKHLPDFKMGYELDFRQQIAESWPGSIDDSAARQDWHWKPEYDLSAMVVDMLKNLG